MKEEEEKKSALPDAPDSEQHSSGETEEKRDIFQEKAEQNVYGQIEEEREIRRKQREEAENISNQQGFDNKDENPTVGGSIQPTEI